MDKANTLRAVDLSCVRQQIKLFFHLNFELHPGDVLLVEGPNGSGKSSLLRLLAGLATPTDGAVFWQNTSIQTHREYPHQVHYVSHANGIKLGLTVTENLQLMQQLNGAASMESYENILTALQLQSQQHVLAKYLSAGQKRRLALAKLFLVPRKIWLLDEPLTALDVHTQIFFLSQLEAHLNQQGISIMSSHQAMDLQHLSTTTLRLTSC